MAVNYTPMIEQYREIKSRHSQEILFFRLGDFYEMFFDDAELAARELEITLTSREAGLNVRVPMCGIPYHAVDSYVAKLIAKGYKIAICEQVEDPKQAKGIVRREVIKIITPGTVLAESLLSDNNNFLAILCEENNSLGLAVADISTGECLWAVFTGPDKIAALNNQLYRLLPAEIVVVGKLEQMAEISQFLHNRLPNCLQTNLTDMELADLDDLPGKHFPAGEIPANPAAFTAVEYLLGYLHQMVKTDLSHLNRLTEIKAAEHLIIDSNTLRNLEITRNMRDGGRKGTLLSVLDFTRTPMGGRTLRRWLEYPLLNRRDIEARQDAIQYMVDNYTIRENIREHLKNIHDLERILTRIEVDTANARDLIALKDSLLAIPPIKQLLTDNKTDILRKINQQANLHNDVVGQINEAIKECPPFSVREGQLIKDGYDLELDQLREIARDSKHWIQKLETKEKETTGIRTLKVGYNRVFGYYIEVSKSYTAAVPEHYVRKQTLANAERYITSDLKEFETKVLGAEEKIIQLEYHLFTTIRDYVKDRLVEIQQTARCLADLDALLSLAEAAARYNYIRPVINDRREINITESRHPVVERLLKQEIFVPNDVELNHREAEVLIITGPNMAGKSTYMRQVALLVLMAQVGSFIPAAGASISPVDRIFTRIGASDDLATGQSTFMVEMNEVAQILKYATPNSLIILDEIGRGTSTFDGMSIARGVIEYIKQRIKALTLFATHYHELTSLVEDQPGIKNYSVAIKEKGNNIIFLRRIVPGGTDKSYGIHVAQLAGLPKQVIKRAQEILTTTESNQTNEVLANRPAAGQPECRSLFTDPIIDELLSLDVLTMTPIEALNVLYRLHNEAKAGRTQ